eukprot:CAMPEP_0178396720 /NCGR_PEP_ID=MMETSP0689_2-20121128/13872_1 /TAXON_ID=160604 /ORGANISM="Amphidinium massartii, Strain CS-259" /LENGTH=1619 /DNA_ID=CAMNT_0020017399 /DNA_START=1 /DNA_END=4860 /DNA_ORIENTATION=-
MATIANETALGSYGNISPAVMAQHGFAGPAVSPCQLSFFGQQGLNIGPGGSPALHACEVEVLATELQLNEALAGGGERMLTTNERALITDRLRVAEMQAFAASNCLLTSHEAEVEAYMLLHSSLTEETQAFAAGNCLVASHEAEVEACMLLGTPMADARVQAAISAEERKWLAEEVDRLQQHSQVLQQTVAEAQHSAMEASAKAAAQAEVTREVQAHALRLQEQELATMRARLEDERQQRERLELQVKEGVLPPEAIPTWPASDGAELPAPRQQRAPTIEVASQGDKTPMSERPSATPSARLERGLTAGSAPAPADSREKATSEVTATDRTSLTLLDEVRKLSTARHAMDRELEAEKEALLAQRRELDAEAAASAEERKALTEKVQRLQQQSEELQQTITEASAKAAAQAEVTREAQVHALRLQDTEITNLRTQLESERQQREQLELQGTHPPQAPQWLPEVQASQRGLPTQQAASRPNLPYQDLTDMQQAQQPLLQPLQSEQPHLPQPLQQQQQLLSQVSPVPGQQPSLMQPPQQQPLQSPVEQEQKKPQQPLLVQQLPPLQQQTQAQQQPMGGGAETGTPQQQPTCQQHSPWQQPVQQQQQLQSPPPASQQLPAQQPLQPRMEQERPLPVQQLPSLQQLPPPQQLPRPQQQIAPGRQQQPSLEQQWQSPPGALPQQQPPPLQPQQLSSLQHPPQLQGPAQQALPLQQPQLDPLQPPLSQQHLQPPQVLQLPASNLPSQNHPAPLPQMQPRVPAPVPRSPMVEEQQVQQQHFLSSQQQGLREITGMGLQRMPPHAEQLGAAQPCQFQQNQQCPATSPTLHEPGQQPPSTTLLQQQQQQQQQPSSSPVFFQQRILEPEMQLPLDTTQPQLQPIQTSSSQLLQRLQQTYTQPLQPPLVAAPLPQVLTDQQQPQQEENHFPPPQAPLPIPQQLQLQQLAMLQQSGLAQNPLLVQQRLEQPDLLGQPAPSLLPLRQPSPQASQQQPPRPNQPQQLPASLPRLAQLSSAEQSQEEDLQQARLPPSAKLQGQQSRLLLPQQSQCDDPSPREDAEVAPTRKTNVTAAQAAAGADAPPPASQSQSLTAPRPQRMYTPIPPPPRVQRHQDPAVASNQSAAHLQFRPVAPAASAAAAKAAEHSDHAAATAEPPQQSPSLEAPQMVDQVMDEVRKAEEAAMQGAEAPLSDQANRLQQELFLAARKRWLLQQELQKALDEKEIVEQQKQALKALLSEASSPKRESAKHQASDEDTGDQHQSKSRVAASPAEGSPPAPHGDGSSLQRAESLEHSHSLLLAEVKKLSGERDALDRELQAEKQISLAQRRELDSEANALYTASAREREILAELRVSEDECKALRRQCAEVQKDLCAEALSNLRKREVRAFEAERARLTAEAAEDPELNVALESIWKRGSETPEGGWKRSSSIMRSPSSSKASRSSMRPQHILDAARVSERSSMLEAAIKEGRRLQAVNIATTLLGDARCLVESLREHEPLMQDVESFLQRSEQERDSSRNPSGRHATPGRRVLWSADGDSRAALIRSPKLSTSPLRSASQEKSLVGRLSGGGGYSTRRLNSRRDDEAFGAKPMSALTAETLSATSPAVVRSLTPGRRPDWRVDLRRSNLFDKM